MTLLVTRSAPVAEGIRLLEFRHPAGLALPTFTPGAHVAVQVPSGAIRTYSLCGDPADRDRYMIAVKRDPAGRGGSVSLVDGVRVGDPIQVSPPRNLFPLAPAGPAAIFVAGGIGITPILPMLRHLRSNGTPFHLYYLTRTPAATAFLAELSDPDLSPHVTVHHDDGDPDRAFDLWPVFETPSKAQVYCCGPRPLMDAVRDMTGHWADSALHFEDFGTHPAPSRADDAPFTIRLAQSGEVLPVPAGQSILEVLRAHGRRLPSSCESGSCGTCRTTVLAGEVEHRDFVLTPAERRTAMLVCVSRGAGEVVLDL